MTPADRPELLALFSASFGAAPDPRDWAFKYDACPHPAISVVLVEGGRLVAHFGGWGTRYRGAAGDLPGLAAVDVMTARSERHLAKGRLYASAGEAFFRANAAGGAPFVFGFPHDKAGRVGRGLLGYVAVERAGQLTRALSREVPRRRGHAVHLGSRVTAAHDALAEALHARDGWRTDRSRRTLDWRLSRPGAAYRVLELHDPRGRSLAYAAVRMVMERALLVDLQAADEEGPALPDLLGAVEAAVGPLGVASLSVRLPRTGPLWRRLTGELGFLEDASDTDFTVRRLNPGGSDGPTLDYRYLDHDVF